MTAHALDTNAFDRVLHAVETTTGHGSRGDARQRTARCPAHDDRSPSLSITRGESRVLIKCHAGCDTDDILTALGLTRADLFDEPIEREEERPRIIATYDYIDEHGELLYQVVRMHPKTFRQRRPANGGDGWVWSLGETRRVLYRLPDVITTAAAGGTIYITEGEKDVHAIEQAGATATCNSGGAGKWHDDYARHLQGAHVIIVADKDEPGRQHATRVGRSLINHAASIRIVEAAEGKDAADHLAAGHTLAQLVTIATEPPAGPDETPKQRAVRLTPASAIKIRPVHWLWKQRIAIGTFALLGGREGIGKSTLAYQLVADITRGRLDGAYADTPRAVIVAATEDSWEHTIVPRLMAARADLSLVYRIDVTTPEGLEAELSLPSDLVDLERAVEEVQAALILLDPLMSRLSSRLDSHKDAEVRQALEPLVKIADRQRAAILGIIHVNKSGRTDPLELIMGSKAFTAVARAVLFALKDPDNEDLRMVGEPKNNLGRTDLPTLIFRIDSYHVADTDEGPVFTGRLNWQGETERTITEILQSSGEAPEERTAVKEAADWLTAYLSGMPERTAPYKLVAEQARLAGHSISTLKRARVTVHVISEEAGFPARSYWRLPFAGAETPSNWTPSSVLRSVRPDEPTGQSRTDSPVGSTEPTGQTIPNQHCPESPKSPEAPVGSTTLEPTGQTIFETAEYPSIRARAQGDFLVEPTGDFSPVRPTRPLSPDLEPTGLSGPAPPCPRCEWPLDHPTHHDICGDDQ